MDVCANCGGCVEAMESPRLVDRRRVCRRCYRRLRPFFRAWPQDSSVGIKQLLVAAVFAIPAIAIFVHRHEVFSKMAWQEEQSKLDEQIRTETVDADRKLHQMMRESQIHIEMTKAEMRLMDQEQKMRDSGWSAATISAWKETQLQLIKVDLENRIK